MNLIILHTDTMYKTLEIKKKTEIIGCLVCFLFYIRLNWLWIEWFWPRLIFLLLLLLLIDSFNFWFNLDRERKSLCMCMAPIANNIIRNLILYTQILFRQFPVDDKNFQKIWRSIIKADYSHMIRDNSRVIVMTAKYI